MATARAQVSPSGTPHDGTADTSILEPGIAMDALGEVAASTVEGSIQERRTVRQILDELEDSAARDAIMETFNRLGPQSTLSLVSSASSAQPGASEQSRSQRPSNEGQADSISLEAFRNHVEDMPPRAVRVPPSFPRASESEWRRFENFFNADRYHFFDKSTNLSCYHFLRTWSLWLERRAAQEACFNPHNFNNMPPIQLDTGAPSPRHKTVSAYDLNENGCNFQGINWRALGTTSAWVREARRKTYIHRTNRMENIYRSPPYNEPNGPHRVRRYMDRSGMAWAKEIPQSDNHFRFRQMFVRHRPHLAHFQLRDMMSAASKNAVFHAAESKVWCMNPQTGKRVLTLDLSTWRYPEKNRGTITTVTARNDVLLVGGWDGQYAMKSLLSENDGNYEQSWLAHNHDASINHIHSFLSRQGSSTQAAISSNDCRIRIIDCSTNKLVQTHSLPSAVNCSVTSPDGRLRLQVGDQTEPWILDADSGELLVRLPGHRDFGFACDWAQDGIHAATGNQDGIVQIWDSRNWFKPLQILSTELSGVRTMQFSPIGSGKRVLAMAEPADLVSIVDAETFKSKQRFEFLGEIGGLSFTPDGQRMYVANTDRLYGGILEFERAGEGERYGMARPDPINTGYSVDVSDIDDDVLMHSSTSRKRRAIGLEEVMI